MGVFSTRSVREDRAGIGGMAELVDARISWMCYGVRNTDGAQR